MTFEYLSLIASVAEGLEYNIYLCTTESLICEGRGVSMYVVLCFVHLCIVHKGQYGDHQLPLNQRGISVFYDKI